MEYNELDIALMGDEELFEAFMKSIPMSHHHHSGDAEALAELILKARPSFLAYMRARSSGFDWNSRVGVAGRLLKMPMVEGPAGMLRSRWAPVRAKFVPVGREHATKRDVQ